MEKYDSKADTLEHIRRVGQLLNLAATELLKRANVHDNSKLSSPEKELFDEMTPLLAKLEYNSPEYKASLERLGVALRHHYANNSHHPEHYPNGVDDMDLFDVIEMFFDWWAATERHNNGDLRKSIDSNETRFKMSPQLAQIFRNTANNMNYEPKIKN
jgi:hypothetical protein